MVDLSFDEIRALPARSYAEKYHRSLGETDYWKVHPSPNAIGGHYGIAWYEIFEDEGGKKYKVYCTDGVYSSRGPYREETAEGENGEINA